MAVNWNRQRILAALREQGTTAAALAEQAQMSRFTFYAGLAAPYPKVQALVSGVLGLPVQHIWPEFYDEGGQRRHLIRRKPISPKAA